MSHPERDEGDRPHPSLRLVYGWSGRLIGSGLTRCGWLARDQRVQFAACALEERAQARNSFGVVDGCAASDGEETRDFHSFTSKRLYFWSHCMAAGSMPAHPGRTRKILLFARIVRE